MNMKAVQVPSAGADFEIVERPVPEPGPGQVRVKVEACGICHSDVFVKEGLFPGIEYPRIPGHEIAGVVDAVGDGVEIWQPGQRVGVGWHGGHCFRCNPCRHGDFINCANAAVTGISYDGGYAEYMLAPENAVAAVPDDLAANDAAPLLCAGITTFNALRSTDASPGDLVAVLSIGGLGHLGVQYARQMGFQVAALSHGPDKRELAEKLGAHVYIDTRHENAVEALQNLGGARVILATAPSSKVISGVVDGLGPNGVLLVVGADAEPLQISPLQLIMGRKRVQGWPSGDAMDSEETLHFSDLNGVKPMIETHPLEQAAQAYERMMSGNARFRVVLTME